MTLFCAENAGLETDILLNVDTNKATLLSRATAIPRPLPRATSSPMGLLLARAMANQYVLAVSIAYDSLKTHNSIANAVPPAGTAATGAKVKQWWQGMSRILVSRNLV